MVAMALAIVPVRASPTPGNTCWPCPTSPTDQIKQCRDYAGQWTGIYGNFYHPQPLGCQPYDAATDYTAVDGAMETPDDFPYLASGLDHSAGWIDMSFPNGSWMQVGWFGGCAGNGNVRLCANDPLLLYDESSNAATGAYILANDGPLGYFFTDIYRIDYTASADCWDIFNSYNNLLRALCGTFPHSGTAEAFSEVTNFYAHNAATEMPYFAYYGSTNPGTNSGLRIKGPNGWEVWSNAPTSGLTDAYDERLCPNPSYCPNQPPYWYSDIVPSAYYFRTYGD